MRAPVLLHVVLTREGLIALGTEGILLAGVLFGVSRGVTGGGEVVGAADLLGHRARVVILLGRRLVVGSDRHGRHARRFRCRRVGGAIVLLGLVLQRLDGQLRRHRIGGGQGGGGIGDGWVHGRMLVVHLPVGGVQEVAEVRRCGGMGVAGGLIEAAVRWRQRRGGLEAAGVAGTTAHQLRRLRGEAGRGRAARGARMRREPRELGLRLVRGSYVTTVVEQ